MLALESPLRLLHAGIFLCSCSLSLLLGHESRLWETGTIRRIWKIESEPLTPAFRLCLSASLFGLLNILIHLGYGIVKSKLLLTALALAVSQIVCYIAAIWLRSCRKVRKVPEFSILTHRGRPKSDRIRENWSNLVLQDVSSPQGIPRNLEKQHFSM